MHDSVGELAQPFGGTDWKSAGVAPVPGKNAPNMAVVERDYPNIYKKFTSLGPLLEKLGELAIGEARFHIGLAATRHQLEDHVAFVGCCRNGLVCICCDI